MLLPAVLDITAAWDALHLLLNYTDASMLVVATASLCITIRLRRGYRALSYTDDAPAELHVLHFQAEQQARLDAQLELHKAKKKQATVESQLQAQR
jgi:hypothetical protein